MANTRSARKQIRVNERKRIRNRAVRSEVRTFVAKARKALLQPAAGLNVEEALRTAVRALDRAAEKGILHRNNVIRRKSRLTSMAAKLMNTAQDAGEAVAARAAAAGGAKGRTTKTGSTAKAATKKPAAKSASKPAAKAASKTAAKAPAKAAAKQAE